MRVKRLSEQHEQQGSRAVSKEVAPVGVDHVAEQLQALFLSDRFAGGGLVVGKVQVTGHGAVLGGPDDECPAALATRVAGDDPGVQVGLGASHRRRAAFTEPGKESAGGIDPLSGAMRQPRSQRFAGHTLAELVHSLNYQRAPVTAGCPGEEDA
ncbi:hypothetical protein [Amycolatopsis anabasis]|uniref:hypothetical protein n=1 Tax=Amycolatopsis anabasis TaxID=1840409 RepID=UPI00131AAF30|nr:hypothetical protein [Amycolatopsis anabasis]